MKQGGSVLVAIGLLIAGLFVVHAWSDRAAQQTTAQAAPDASLQTAFAARVLALHDANDLLQRGTKLAATGNLTLAAIALRQAADIAPANRDVQLALAWCDLHQIQLGQATDRAATLAAAGRSLAAARQVDPLSPQLAGLVTLYRQLGGDA